MTVRALTSADLPRLMAIEHAGFEHPWTEAMLSDDLERPDRVWLGALDEQEIVGFGGVMVIGDEGHLLDLAVEPQARRQGVGRTLVWELARAAHEGGAVRITLEVAESNQEARALYASCGFDEGGRRTGYYAPSGEDALLLWSRPLGPALAAIDAARAGQELILAVETSCDETAASVMRGGSDELSAVIASQIDFHARFGGVVPEIASRKHTEAVVAVAQQALDEAGVGVGDLHAVAVTQGPGLVGALVVGLAYAKGLALGTGLPLVGVNHLEGHIYAARLHDPTLKPPVVALLVSGGHTLIVHVPEWGRYEVLGRTLDDAAGEAFDKVAKLLGLGYPGGPIISRLAAGGDPSAIDFPRAMMRSGDLDMSLSGLKTAVIQHVERERAAGRELRAPDIAASFQQAVVDVKVAKTLSAAVARGARAVVLAGGVAANPTLREGLRSALGTAGISLSVPPLGLCTDNASMIAAAAHDRLAAGHLLGLSADAVPNLRLNG